MRVHGHRPDTPLRQRTALRHCATTRRVTHAINTRRGGSGRWESRGVGGGDGHEPRRMQIILRRMGVSRARPPSPQPQAPLTARDLTLEYSRRV